MSRRDPKMQAISREDLLECLARVQKQVSSADFDILSALGRAYVYLIQALSAARVSVARLKRLFLGLRTEKTKDVLGVRSKDGDGDPSGAPRSSGSGSSGSAGTDPAGKRKRKPPRVGHGRIGADAYTGAEKTFVPHRELSPGCLCPQCRKGKLEPLPSGKLLRLFGNVPVSAKIWELAHLRCRLCRSIFHAQVPPEAKGLKCDASAVAMVAVLHFGNGMPYHRLAQLQSRLGIPLPASIQSTMLRDAALVLRPVHEELIRQAAQAEIIHTDDTGMKVLSLLAAIKVARDAEGASSAAPAKAKKKLRTGIFTTGVVAVNSTRRIALYFTGAKHAGENLERLLKHRAPGLPPPIHMSDGLDRNDPATAPTRRDKCMAHGRRQFVDIVDNFPDECARVLVDLRVVYQVDAVARERQLTAMDRLHLHQEKSAPVMDQLRRWMEGRLLDTEVEPNSGLGRAIAYLLRYWEPLTLFLREPGAPLDNNIAERILKKAIRHRKNSLFFKTTNGAAVGDLFMALLETCSLNGVDPFQYLVALLRNGPCLVDSPATWMPWNYEDRLQEPPTAEDRAPRPDTAVESGAVDSDRDSSETFVPPPTPSVPVLPTPPPPLPTCRWPAGRSAAVLNARLREGQRTLGPGPSLELPLNSVDPAGYHAPPMEPHPT